MIMKASYFIGLSLAISFPLHASAGYNCGTDYHDAISNCDHPCPSQLGYSAGAVVNECPQDKPLCFENVQCDDANATVAAAANATDVTVLPQDDFNITSIEFDEAENATVSAQDDLNVTYVDSAEASNSSNVDEVAEGDDEPEILEMVANSEAADLLPPTTSPAPTTVAYKLLEERRNLPNPGNHFCAVGWSEATVECETNVNAIPCAPDETGTYLPCPLGTFCYGISDCVRATLSPTAMPTILTTDAPTTASPSSNPISASDPANFYFCGIDLADANENCGTWCRYGTNEECPEGQTCQFDSTCDATALNLTIGWDQRFVTEVPSLAPTTYTPTINDNPENLYCSATWLANDYTGPCGFPCPSRDGCPDGQFCYQSLTCTRQPLHKMKWCGKDMDDMVARCGADGAKQCNSGKDEECGEGEKCFLSDACLKKEEMAASEGMMWCGRSYKHLVENCPKQCPGGTNEECGQDETGVDMTCFNMKDENVTCAEEGVGIKNVTDPDMLWCGNDWMHLVENCPKKCPEGTDEECGFMGTTCFDMTGSDLICMTEGFGVKPKGDPMKRFCGNTFAHMHSACPKRCPSGSADECPEEMSCFEDSLCEIEGVGVVGMEENDPAKMFCVKNGEATCTPCPNQNECGDGEECWADMEWACQGGMVSQSATVTEATEADTAVDVSVEFEEAAAEEPVEEEPEPQSEPVDISVQFDESKEEPAAEAEPQSEPAESVTEVALASEPAESEPVSESAPVSEPVASEPVVSEPAVSEPAAASAASEPVPASASQTEPVVAMTTSVSDPTLQVENLRMALYGMSQLTADQVNAWEVHTEAFFEEFYDVSSTGDATRDVVSSVDTSFEGTQFGMSSGRRNLRVQRNLATAFLITYNQKIKFESSSDVSLADVVQHPFSTASFRDEYVSYLKLKEPVLFAELSEVSAVFLPVEMSDPVVIEPSVEATVPESTNTIVDESGKYKNFKCHNSGAACPSGECPDGDHCMLFATTSTNIEPYSAPATSSEESASSMLNSVLSGQSSVVATDSVSAAAFGPSNVNGKMLLSGVNLVNSEHLTEWSFQTAVYVQDFYNIVSNSADYVQNKVYNVQTRFEILSVKYGTESEPSTEIAFVQTTEWDSFDESIEILAIVNQPFMTEAYRQAYVEHLEKYLPGTFKLVTEPSVTAAESSVVTPNNNFSDSFFCGTEWTAIDCSNAQHCDNADDCQVGHGCFVAQQCLTLVEKSEATPQSEATPVITESNLSCNLCKPGQVGVDAEIIFNEDLTRCAVAYDYMVTHYNEGHPTCVAAQDALSSTCCKDSPSSDLVQNSEPVDITETSTTPASETIAQSVQVEEPELLYPAETYYCGSSFDDASSTCSKPCPSGQNSECLGEGQTCFGNTECDHRASFFCGTSWLGASDKCSKPCPNGDASVCGEDEKCYAWTSCTQTQSYYCGSSFENASNECKIPCESRSSLDCPDGMQCWGYTTCESTKEGAHESGPVKLNDFFCGESKEAASSTCSIACQSGSDSECPGDLKCFDGTGCSAREQFWCGSDWLTAAKTCSQPCPTGSSDECGEGQSCYAHTECQSDLFFCGDSFKHASETCGQACSSRTSNECPNGQSCYAFVTACAKSEAAQSMAESYTLMAANNEWGIDNGSFAKDDSEENLFKGEQTPDWYVTWQQEQMKSSSSKAATLISFVGLVLAGFSALLAF